MRDCGTCDEIGDILLNFAKDFHNLSPAEQDLIRKTIYERVTGLPYRPPRIN